MKFSCRKFGAPVEPDRWLLFEVAFLIALMPIGVLIGGASWHDSLARKVIGLYELPLMMAGAMLIDHNSTRRKIYLYGGIAAGLGLLLSLA